MDSRGMMHKSFSSMHIEARTHFHANARANMCIYYYIYISCLHVCLFVCVCARLCCTCIICAQVLLRVLMKPRDGTYDAWDVSIRPSVPAIPRFLVPQTILSLVATLQLEAGQLHSISVVSRASHAPDMVTGSRCQVDTYKKTILPVAYAIREFFRWRKPKWMALVLVLLLFRSYVSFEAFLDEESWCHFALKCMQYIRISAAYHHLLALGLVP